MHPRLQEIVDFVRGERAALHALIASIPEERLERRPGPEGWSPLQVLEHLALVEPTFLAATRPERGAGARQRALRRAVAEDARRAARHLFGTGGEGPFVTPEPMRPTGVRPLEASLAESRERLLRLLEGAEGLALDEVTRAHRVFGDLTALDWVVYLGVHERRHVRQIERITGQEAHV